MILLLRQLIAESRASKVIKLIKQIFLPMCKKLKIEFIAISLSFSFMALAWFFGRKLLKYLAAASMCIFGVVHAQNWQAIEYPHHITNKRVEVDRDSIVKTPTGAIALTWRRSMLPPPFADFKRRHITESGHAFCDEWTYTRDVMRVVEGDSVASRVNGLVVMEDDFTAKISSTNGKKESMTDFKYFDRYQFPRYDDEYAAVLTAVCHEGADSIKQRAISYQATLNEGLFKCDKTERENEWMCQRNDELALAVFFANKRFNQIREARPDSGSKYAQFLVKIYNNKALCSSTTKCAEELNAFARGVGHDLAQHLDGNRETPYLSQKLKQLEKDKAETVAVAQYLACLPQKIRALDDRLTSADVVASAVFASCRAMLPEKLANNRNMAEAEQPKITAAILEARNLRPLPTTKKPPATKPF